MSKASLSYLMVPLLMLFPPFWLSNCAPRLVLVEGGRYSDPQGYFELSIPENGWQLLSWKGVDFVLWDPEEGTAFVVDVTPLKEDVELATLARHLLIAFERKRILSQGAEKVNGREAVKTELEGWVDGTEIKAEAYVVKGDGVLYDIIFWAPREAFPRKADAFRQFVDDIAFLQP
jgi:hypothetical protein